LATATPVRQSPRRRVCHCAGKRAGLQLQGRASGERRAAASRWSLVSSTPRLYSRKAKPRRGERRDSRPAARRALEPGRSMADRGFDRRVYHVRATTRRLRSGPYIRHPDAKLVAMTAEGDTAAYDELVERYQNAAKNRAKSITKDYQAAEDVTQEAFIKAYAALKDLAEPHKYGVWLLRIVQHTALDHLRGRKDGISLETMKDQGYEAPRQTKGLQIEKLENREEELRVLEALGELRPDYCEIIVLKHLEGLSYKEIAERLEMSVSAVGEKLSRVRGMLKRSLSKKQIPSGREKPEEGDA